MGWHSQKQPLFSGAGYLLLIVGLGAVSFSCLSRQMQAHLHSEGFIFKPQQPFTITRKLVHTRQNTPLEGNSLPSSELDLQLTAEQLTQNSGQPTQSPGISSSSTQQVTPDPCQAEWRLQLRDHLHTIVVIVDFTTMGVANRTAPLIRNLYSTLFDTVVLLGAEDSPEIGLEARVPANSTDLPYTSLQRVIRQNPEAEGFLWLTDDVALNYWNLIRADKSKVWVRRYEGMHFPFNVSESSEFDGDWAGNAELRQAASGAFNSMEDTLKAQLVQSMSPFLNHYPKRHLDLVYLPRRHADVFSTTLIPIYSQHKVPFEIALPMMLFSIQHPNEFDSVFDNMVYSWDQGFDPLEEWTKELSAVKPWNIYALPSRVNYLKTMSSVDPCVRSVDGIVFKAQG